MSVNRSKVQQDADRLARLGKVDDAISLYQQLLQGSPRDMNIKSRIGELHFRAGFISGAVKILREVAEFYESEGFHLKSVAVRKRISEIGPPLADGEESRSAPASKKRAKTAAPVLPFLDPAAEPGRARAGVAPAEPRPAAAPAAAEVPAAPEPFAARAAEAVERFRKVDVEHRRVQERLGVIEDKRGATLPVVFEKVRKDALVKLGALSQVREACGREVTAVRDAAVAELQRVKARLIALGTDLEEVRFLQNIGDFTTEEFNRGEAAKLGEMETARRRLGTLTGLTAELDAVIGERAVAEAAAVVEPPSGEAALAAQPLPAAPADPPRPAAQPLPAAPADPPRPASQPLPVAPADPPRPASQPLPVAPADPPHLAAAAAPASPPEAARDAAPVAKAPRPVLVVRWKGARQREEVCYLATGLSIIGRGSESEILLLEKSISRRHASLRLEDGEAYLTDLESGNGCYVNGERLPPVDPRKLNDGDVIRLGELEMVYWSMRPRSDD